MLKPAALGGMPFVRKSQWRWRTLHGMSGVCPAGTAAKLDPGGGSLIMFKVNIYLTVVMLGLALANCAGGSFGGLSTGSMLSGRIYAPTVVQPHNPGDVVGVQIQNNTDHADGPQLVTFGQAFVKGEVPAGTQLVALVDGQQIPVQVDVKTTNDDGSVRFAVITLQTPALTAHGAVDVMLAKGTPAAQPDVQVGTILQHGYDLQLHLTMHNSDGTTTPLTINAANLLTQALQNGTAQTWLDGSLANEVRVSAPINQYLTATFDIRAYADGSVHTDVQVANTALYTPGNQSYTYDVAITEGGQTVFSDAGITHYKNADWHEEIWSNGKPDAHVVFDVDHLIASGAIQAYDTSIGINSSAIDATVNKLATSDTGPLGSALVQVTMPTTGGRPDLGPTTTWAATYLVSQDERAENVMLANADAAGSAPWHFYDEATGRPVAITDHPKLWLDYRGTAPTYGSDAPANPIDPNEGGWQIDVAHQPALSYVPYLVTGSHYYLGELEMQGAYSLAWYNPSPRGFDQGLVDSGQVRGMAWTMRTLSDAAFILPDSDPLKQYFVNELNNNLDHFVQKYVVDGALNAAGEAEGWLTYYDSNPVAAPWQDDFFAIILNEMNSRGVEKASEFLQWMDNFESGRFINGDNGFDPLHGSTYHLQIYDPITNEPYSTWQQIYQATFGASATPPTELDGYPNSAGGYAANAKAALASLITGTESPDAIEAYGFVVGHTPKMPAADANDPTWSIMPRLADGHYLHAGDVHVFAGSTGTTMTGTDANELYYGGTGNDTIHGLNGLDLLFGDDGNDFIFGDTGSDHIFGGKGNDRIDGAAGNDYLKGGSGSDTFVFTTSGGGQDTIADFNPASDHLEIGKNINGSGVDTAADVLAQATADSSGNAVLHLGGTDTVTLLGVHPEQLATGEISIVQ
jgi:Ca2+-binding RTX toxin-like protein